MPSKHQLSGHCDHVNAIGMISLETVDLELELATLFSQMLLIPLCVGEAILMTPKSEQARIDILRHAAEAAFAPRPGKRSDSARRSDLERQKVEALNKVKALLKRSQEVINYRHRTMHDDWEITKKRKEIRRIQVDGGLSRVPMPVPIAQLNTQIEKLRQLIDDVTDLAAEFKKYPPLAASKRRR
jgi:hypothetical protein